jgi:molybdate transport system ATP-binding protein
MIDARLVKRFPAVSGSSGFELDVHLKAAPGITALFGPSGAGKSLILNCVGGFARPDSGRILVNDEIYFDAATHIHLAPQKRRCGYIFQDHALFPHMTVRDNLRFAAAAGASSRVNRHRRIKELLEAFELTELAARRPAQLSGGQRQRAALARILVNEPKLLLLDEPTRGLDARLKSNFYDLLRKTKERLEVPILLVTHDLEECFGTADCVGLMEDGKLLQTGPVEAVFSRPVTTDVARLLGIHNVIPATIKALDPGQDTSRLLVLGQEIQGPYLPGHLIGDQGYLCLRFSDLKALPSDVRPIQNHLELRVVTSQPSAEGVKIGLEHGLFVSVSRSSFERLRSSDRLRIEIPPAAVYFVSK